MTKKNKMRARNIELVPLVSISTESQLKVREIRNEEAVRKWMYTDHLIELNEHLNWINKVKSDEKKIVLVILDEDKNPLGVVSISAIDFLHRKANWAYYLTQNSRGGLGPAIEYSLINFVFGTLGLEKLNCEVIEGNDRVVKLHKKFHFQDEGFRRSDILKKGERRGTHYLGLAKENWVVGKEKVLEKYSKIFDKFSISIKWDEENTKKKKHPIDEIEAARARNNLNWMNVLRLVLELSPEHGKALITDIRNIDKEISDLTDKLVAL